VTGTGVAGLSVLAGFAAWERATSHPMLNLKLLRRPSFSAAIGSTGLSMFALAGALFVLTQFLQFDLGYSALQAGVRMLAIAVPLGVTAPASFLVVRAAGTKLTTAAGLALITAGLWQVSGLTLTATFTAILPGTILAGVGAGLVMPAVSGSVMGSLPRGQTGVGAAANGLCTQVGSALGVAVVGSLLSVRYQDRMTAALVPYHLPHAIETTILGSIGGALGVAARAGGATGTLLAHAARAAFNSGAGLGLLTAAAVALAGVVLALAALPARPGGEEDRTGEVPHPDSPLATADENTPAPATSAVRRGRG